MANVGTMTKATHCGWAGAAGLDAALLAKRAFRSYNFAIGAITHSDIPMQENNLRRSAEFTIPRGSLP